MTVREATKSIGPGSRQWDRLVPDEHRYPNEEARMYRRSDHAVQMSVRMDPKSYQEFRSLCRDERRTNGEMLKRMFEVYVAWQNEPG